MYNNKSQVILHVGAFVQAERTCIPNEYKDQIGISKGSTDANCTLGQDLCLS